MVTKKTELIDTNPSPDPIDYDRITRDLIAIYEHPTVA